MKTCQRCGAAVAFDQVGARDVCEKCGAYLHCCRNCQHHQPGAHNDCREPAAEMVADKEHANFCDLFRFADRAAAAKPRVSDARARLDALFKRS